MATEIPSPAGPKASTSTTRSRAAAFVSSSVAAPDAVLSLIEKNREAIALGPGLRGASATRDAFSPNAIRSAGWA